MTAYSHNSSNYKNEMELQILNLKDRYCLLCTIFKKSFNIFYITVIYSIVDFFNSCCNSASCISFFSKVKPILVEQLKRMINLHLPDNQSMTSSSIK